MQRIDEKALRSILKEKVKEAGGPQQWAKGAKISIQYVSDVIHNRRKPGKAIYKALGYEKRVEYVRNS